MSEIERRAREVFAQWHADKGCGSKIIEDCKSGVISMDQLTRELLHMALTPPEGYVLVPVYATFEMRRAGNERMDKIKADPTRGLADMACYAWDAMIDARPEIPNVND